VTCNAANVPYGATVTFVIEAQIQGSVGLVTNRAEIVPIAGTTPDPDTTNNVNNADLVMKGGTGKRK
jgi:hypothetical protein